MAKGKHSVALFEVIQSSKASKPGFTLRTPKWWFKGRKAGAAPAAVEAPTQHETASEMAAASGSMSSPRAHRLDMQLDPDRQRITFHVSYTAAIVGGFALLVAVVLAYMIGQHMRQGPSVALAGQSTEQVRLGPIQPSVLNVGSQKNPAAPADQPRQAAKPPAEQATAPTQPPPQPQSDAPGATIARPGKRIIGQNYIVVQIYPDEKTAIEARDLLEQNNMPCTIEKGLRDYAPSMWYCVVTLAGFDRISGQDYQKYFSDIKRVSSKIVDNPKFKQFDPRPYSWRG